MASIWDFSSHYDSSGDYVAPGAAPAEEEVVPTFEAPATTAAPSTPAKPATPTTTSTTPKFSAEQNQNIRDFYLKNLGDPKAITDAMSKWNVNFDDLTGALGEIGIRADETKDFLIRSGTVDSGFGGLNWGDTSATMTPEQKQLIDWQQANTDRGLYNSANGINPYSDYNLGLAQASLGHTNSRMANFGNAYADMPAELQKTAGIVRPWDAGNTGSGGATATWTANGYNNTIQGAPGGVVGATPSTGGNATVPGGTGTGGNNGSGGTGGSGSGNSGAGGSGTGGSGTGTNVVTSLTNANMRTIDPATETVAGQLQSVIASDSPLMQQARTRALQAQNANGTLNSSMAEQAAQAAVYDKALQIASPDAAIYGSAADKNTDTSNQFIRDDNAQQRQKEVLAIQQQYGLTNMEAQARYDIQKIEAQAAVAKEVAKIEQEYKNLTQASASATSIMNNMQSSLNALYANTSITDAAIRNGMIADVKNNAVSALKMIGALAGNVDIQQYIDMIDL